MNNFTPSYITVGAIDYRECK